MDSVLPMAGKELLSQGLLGIIIFFLIWYIGRKESELKDILAAHKAEIASKDKQIEELSSARLLDVKQLVEIAVGLRSQGQAFLAAIERKSQ
jgi:hypothetical protein